MLRLFGKLAALIVYLCVATLMAGVSGLVYLRANGDLEDGKLRQLLAVVRGEPMAVKKEAENKDPAEQDREQPSFEQREQAGQLAVRHLEMREQALKSGLERIRFEQRALGEDKDRYERLKGAFEEQLSVLRNGALTSGRENVRLIWENIKAKQAKEQILQMIANDEMPEVVAILSAMPIGKRAKIVSEFKSPEEVEKLGEILRLIRQGMPEVNLIDKTQSQVKQP